MNIRTAMMKAIVAPLLFVISRPKMMKAAASTAARVDRGRGVRDFCFFSLLMKSAIAAKAARIEKEPAEFDVVKYPLAVWE